MFQILVIFLYYIKHLDTINDAIEGAESGVPVDIVQIDVTRTWEILGEIIGDTVQESLINQLFSQFCLGK